MAKPVALLLWLTLAAPPLRAESLQEAWGLALAADHGIVAVRADAEAADLEAQAVRAQRWPSLDLGGGYTVLDDAPAFDFAFTGLPLQPPELVDNDDFVMGNATLSVPLFTGGRISSSIAAADARSRGAGLRTSGAEQDLRLAVAEAYVGVLRTRRAVDVTEGNVASLSALAADVGVMYEREAVPRNELLAVQVALADATQNRLRARNAAGNALAAYNRRLGQPLRREVELEETLPAATGLPATLAEAVELARGGRTETQALLQQSESFTQMARAERARSLPQVSLTGGYAYLENQFLDDEDYAYAGVGVRWSVFDGGQSRRRSAALERNRRAVDERRAEVDSLIELQVQEAWFDAQEAEQRIAVTRGAVALAEENLRIARERYGAGLGTNTQLLEAEALRVQALRNRDDALLDAQLSRLQLSRAIGVI